VRNDLIAAYDFGTSGVKAALVSVDGVFVASSECGYPKITPKLGYVEQDTRDYWAAVCEATRHVIARAGIEPVLVKGMSFSTQGAGIIPLGYDGRVLHNNITWLDSRAGEQAAKINAVMNADVQTGYNVPAKLMWLRENEPDLYEKTRYFLDCTGFLVYQCTRQVYMELTNPSPHSLNPVMAERKRNLYRAAGVDLAKLPPLKLCSEFVGNLLADAARELGLTTACKVFMGTSDIAAACAGTACVAPGDAHVYIGSSGWLSVLRETAFLDNPSPAIYQMYGINKDTLIYGGCVQSACMTLNWAIEQFYHAEKMEPGCDIFSLVSREIADIPPGSGGLIATPWLYGEACPVKDENARAVLFNLTHLHDRRHIINAVLEGICYSLRGQIEYYTRDTGRTLERLGACGGGALNDHWMQMLADITKLPVYRPANVQHAGAMGTALVAGVGLGLYGVEEMGQFIRIETTFTPRAEHADCYDKLYGVFKRLYPSLRELYAELN
jgi:xylulokinase